MPLPLDLGNLPAALAEIERETWAGFAADRSVLGAQRRQALVERRARAELKRQLAAAFRALAKTLAFEIAVPGGHYSGLSNQQIFENWADQGRDFGAATRRLRDHVRLALSDQFGDGDHVPLRFEVDEAVKAAVLEWVAARLDGRATDVNLAPLSEGYRREKRRAGYGGRPGTRTGALRDALLARGRVTLH